MHGISELASQISECISEKIAEGYDQDQAVAICMDMDESGELDSGKRSTSGGVMVKSFSLEDADADLGEMEFAGYASTWDMDDTLDEIKPGAFSKTIRERRDRIKVLWEHGDSMGIPLEIREDERGLYTRSRVSDTPTNRERMQLIRDGVVDMMSIGFTIPRGKAEIRNDGITRDIREIKLYEYSAVTFPANEEASIELVRRIARNAGGERLSGRNERAIRETINCEPSPSGYTRDGGEPPETGHSPVDEVHAMSALDELRRFAQQSKTDE